MSYNIRYDVPEYDRQVSLSRPPAAWTSSSDHTLLENSSYESSQQEKSDASTIYNWRPKVMQAPYLIFVGLLSFVLVVVQECLRQKSTKHGSLFEFEKLTDISLSQYVLWRYVPPVSAVSYGIIVATLDFEIMRFAPYHKLAQSKGLEGADHIIREPASYFWYLFNPSKAGALVWVSALGTIAASVLVPMSQNASLVSKHKDGQNYVVSIDPDWSRFLSFVLFVNMGCVAALWFLLRKPTQLKECPYNIAEIISMFGHDCFEDLTQNLSVLSDVETIDRAFEKERFVLQNGVARRVPRLDEPDAKRSTSQEPMPEHVLWLKALRQTSSPLLCKPGSRTFGFIAWTGLGMAPLFALVAFGQFKTFFQTIPWLGTGFAVIYKLVWAQFEVYLRGFDPFSRLRRGNAPPGCLFDDYTGSPLLLMAIRAFKRGSRLLAFQGLCSVLLEVWVIAVTSFCDRSILVAKNGQDDRPTYVSSGRMLSADFYIAGLIATIVPAVTSISAIVVSIRARKSYLPANPTTIANLLLYTQGTRMRSTLEQLRDLDSSSRERRLCREGKRYGLGWFHNSILGASVYIEEEPCFARYEHIHGGEFGARFFRDYRIFEPHVNDQMRLSDFRLYIRGGLQGELDDKLIGVTGIEDHMKGPLFERKKHSFKLRMTRGQDIIGR